MLDADRGKRAFVVGPFVEVMSFLVMVWITSGNVLVLLADVKQVGGNQILESIESRK